MKYIIGAYGTNNVGDEAIFEGASKEYPDLVEIYINKSNRQNSIWYADLLTGKKQFDKNADELIIGGGGLIHSDKFLNDILILIKKAKECGKKVTIQRVGVEGLINNEEKFTPYLKEIFSQCDSISVRSSLSKQLVNNLGYNCEIKRDFAYNIREFPKKKFNFKMKYDNINIGIAPASLNDISFNYISKLISELTLKYNVFILPHSKAYVCIDNNDIITAEKLWSNIEIYHSAREDNFKIIPFTNNPYTMLNYYLNMDYIIGLRYHSFIFADITNRHLLGYYCDKKSKTFFIDNPSLKGISFDQDFSVIRKETLNFIEEVL